jgi:hypothetical protein
MCAFRKTKQVLESERKRSHGFFSFFWLFKAPYEGNNDFI